MSFKTEPRGKGLLPLDGLRWEDTRRWFLTGQPAAPAHWKDKHDEAGHQWVKGQFAMSPGFLVRRFTEKLQALGLKIFRVREPITFALHTCFNIGRSPYSRHARIHAGTREGSMGTCVRFIFARLKVVLRLNDTLGRTIPNRARSTACESKKRNQSRYGRFNVRNTEKVCK